MIHGTLSPYENNKGFSMFYGRSIASDWQRLEKTGLRKGPAFFKGFSPDLDGQANRAVSQRAKPGLATAQ